MCRLLDLLFTPVYVEPTPVIYTCPPRRNFWSFWSPPSYVRPYSIHPRVVTVPPRHPTTYRSHAAPLFQRHHASHAPRPSIQGRVVPGAAYHSARPNIQGRVVPGRR